jgi:ArsR family transcriptional regulator, arsenate/arsenite/antimonite-responsive transcriptional repressor
MDETGLVDVMKALGQPTRLRIMRLLANAPQGLVAGEIASALGVRQNTLSSHMAILARSGLIDGERKGRSITYNIESERARQLAAAMRDLFNTSA